LPRRKDDMGCSRGKRRSKRDKIFILSYPVVAPLPAATTTCFYYYLHCEIM
jgi:hypothetical protein